ncbi:uncharacterized protein [Macrobrachium rosenbergii]|uniref:uncharacterized protein n=1 Tax=Macrobrachium rosenbergii TaxID=79674 RepID=UPI0034D57980
MGKLSEKVAFFSLVALLGIQNLCNGYYSAVQPYSPYCQPQQCYQPMPYVNPCCYYRPPTPTVIPIPITTTTPPPTFAPTIPPIPPPTLAPVPSPIPCYQYCGYCPTHSSPVIASTPASVPQPVCSYGVGRKRRSPRRSCALNSQCPQGSMCCFDGCSGGRVCKREVLRNTSIVDTAWRNPKVTVSLVMTSGSRSAAWFIRSQLLPVYLSLMNFIQIELIPYGLIHQNGACLYGAADCYGNWVVSCSSKYFMNELSTLNFTACLMQYSWVLQGEKLEDVLSVSKMCMEQEARGSEVWRQVSECIKRAEGYQLFLAAGQRQAQIAPGIREVPAVALNGGLVITHSPHLYYFPYMLCRMLANIHEANVRCKQILGQ